MDEINDQQHLSPPVEGLGDQRPSALANGYAYAAKPSNVANHYSTTIYPSSDQQQTLPTVTTEDLSDLNGPDEFDHLTTTFADGLAVDDRGRMDLALSEGEDDDEEDDVIVMKTNIDDNGDKPFERLFSTLTVSAPNAAASQ
ncbi:hypothetical protein FRC02_009272 [Tulasnella sp. 418]|nr:hypothetical protein FRC02_009272 [Tulasnella sp. 418]